MKILIVLVVVAAAMGAVILKNNQGPAIDVKPGEAATNLVTAPAVNAKLPRLLDLGADKCVPCKLMAPILEALKMDYAGRMHVEFIDVWKNTEAAKEYGVDAIPTQIFYNAEGKELFRHVGFFGRDDILGKWKELGVDL